MTDRLAPLSPSPESTTFDFIAKALGNDRNAVNWAHKLTNLINMTPLGIPQAAYQGGQMIGQGAKNIGQGNYGPGALQTATGLGVAGLSAIPGARGLVAKEGESLAQNLLRGEADSAPSIIAYHGSPHKFDKFDISKIGTGEGAQAYGHGLYFAENEKVAKDYRDAFSDPSNIPLQFQGKPVDTVWNQEIADRWGDLTKRMSPQQLEDFTTVLGNLSQVNDLGQVKHVLTSLNQPQRQMYQKLVAPNLIKPPVPEAQMYQVKINADPAHFLDWDAPLGAQNPAIQDFAKSVAVPQSGKRSYVATKAWQEGKDLGYPVTGSTLHSILSDYGTDPKLHQEATNLMQNAGIPGIKYLDQGSRQAGQGSRNYVVFNPNIVDIMKRYAIPFTAAGGGTAAMLGNQQQPNRAPLGF